MATLLSQKSAIVWYLRAEESASLAATVRLRTAQTRFSTLSGEEPLDTKGFEDSLFGRSDVVILRSRSRLMDENGDRLAEIMLQLRLRQHPSAEPPRRFAHFFYFTGKQQLARRLSPGFPFFLLFCNHFFFRYLATPFFPELDRQQMAFCASVPFGSHSKH